MCGILGTVNRPFGHEVLDLLSHRGPDDSGIHSKSVGDHLLTLGQRRLAIQDLSSAGHQPMWTSGQRHGIIFNGEIYNHAELRQRILSVPYRGHSDTETLLHVFAQRGMEWLDQLNGIFAFGFVDVGSRKLFLARDPFGVKPIYYWTDNKSLVFSSELRALRALVDDSLETSHLAELLRLRYLPAPDTLFKNIRKVRPGHVIEIDLNGPNLSHREYPFAQRTNTQAPVKTQVEVVREYGRVVEQAVKRQLLSDVPVGILLSGGIDSALVASLAQKHANHRMQAFTVGFTDAHSTEDEILDARDTARIVGLDHHEVRIGFAEFLDMLPRIAEIVEEPLATTSVVPMFFVSSLASKFGKVVLSGQGADEALGGYRRYQAELLHARLPGFALALLKKIAPLLKVRYDAVLRGLESLGELEDIRRFEQTYSVFNKSQILKLTGHHENRATERIQYFYNLLGCAALPTSVQRMTSLDLRMNLSDDLLLYTDKLTMHHSLECRVPLLDLELVRFLESLPIQHRVGLFRTKIVHRKFAASVLPWSIIRRKKKGFLSPTAKWFKKSGALREILLQGNSHFSSYFDLCEVDRILREHASGINRERQIFLLLNVYYWMSENARRSRRPAFSGMSMHI